MSFKPSTDYDWQGKGAIRGVLLDPVSTDPGLGASDMSRFWFNTTGKRLKYWDGTTVIDPRDRATHSGTQLSSTISDLAAIVQAYRLDQFAAATSPITVPNGTAAGHAINKSQLDAVAAAAASGIAIKAPVRVASTGNVTIGSTGNGATMDTTITLATGDRVLLKDQTTASQNGIYVVGASSLTRAGDADENSELSPGTAVYVQAGQSNGDKLFAISSDATITVGTTTITWAQIGSSTTYSGTAPISVSGGAVSLSFTTGFAGGLVNSSGSLAIDNSVQARKIVGVVPTATAGAFTISGANVTLNHNLNNYAPLFGINAYTSPYTGFTQGDPTQVTWAAQDANNTTFTLPAAPTANAWVVSVVG